MNVHAYWISECLRLATENAKLGGGPFAAIIVKEGKVVSEGVNLVTNNNDPTAHAEIVAIRSAAAELQDFQLEGCTIYCSCEPCPMCFGAIYWARPSELFYAASKTDAADAGFDDHFIYDELARASEDRKLPFKKIEHKEALMPFREWLSNDAKKEY